MTRKKKVVPWWQTKTAVAFYVAIGSSILVALFPEHASVIRDACSGFVSQLTGLQ